MTQSSANVVEFPSDSSGDVLTEILRKEARDLFGRCDRAGSDGLPARASGPARRGGAAAGGPQRVSPGTAGPDGARRRPGQETAGGLTH